MITREDLDAFGYYEDSYMRENYHITMSGYQKVAEATAIYGLEHQITYPALGLAGEAGEVANKVKKLVRDGELDRAGVVSELGDCLWYISALCRDLNVDMGDVAKANLKKLQDRKERGTISGNGDNR